MTPFTITKNDHHGQQVWSYKGELLERGAGFVQVKARFNVDDKNPGFVVFRRGDTFIEWHYSDRWYNIFQLHDVSDGRLKGWYCNIVRPAHITADTVAADDLALDVFVSPTGETLVVDEDEFAELNLSPDEQRAARTAVAALLDAAASRQPPFDLIEDR
jgi:hypothetical protein